MRAQQTIPRRMRSTGLVGRRFEAAEEVVRHQGAMQAQDFGPAKWSIGQRAKRVTDGDVEAAVDDGSIIRTHVLRPTWHFVSREDIRWLLSLTGPLVQRRSAPRYRELGLDARTLARCERAIAFLPKRPWRGGRMSRSVPGLLMALLIFVSACSSGTSQPAPGTETVAYKLAVIHGDSSAEPEFQRIIDCIQASGIEGGETEEQVGDTLVASWEQSGKRETLLEWAQAFC